MSTNANPESSSPVQETEDWDPHLHRVLSHPNTNPETLLHILKGCLGTGILAMPEAFKHSGLVIGIISTIVLGIFNTYCIHVLIRAQYVICKKKRKAMISYPEAMKLAFEIGPENLKKLTKHAEIATEVVFLLFQLGVCSVYIIFIGENTRQLLNYYLDKDLKLVYYVLMCFVPFVLIASVRNLKIFAPFSFMGNVFSLVTYGVLAYFVSHELTPIAELKMAGNCIEYPLFFGTAVFALQSITVTVFAESNMARPMDFRRPFGVLNMAMMTIVLLYLFVGIMGYWRYSSDIKPSITLNIPIGEAAGQIIRILYSLAIYVSYGLNVLVADNMFWNSFIKKRYGYSASEKLLCDYAIRLICVILTNIFAISVPFLGLFISFIGNVFLTCLLFIFPALMEICAYWPDEFGTKRWRLWKNVVLIVLAFLVLILGTLGTVYKIVLKYSE